MAKSTERHSRERLAVIAKSLAISAEQVRKAGIIRRTFSDGPEALTSGKYRVNKLFKMAKGDSRVGLHVLIEPEIRDAIKASAQIRGITVNEWVNRMINSHYQNIVVTEEPANG
jgi:hypothetical protein